MAMAPFFCRVCDIALASADVWRQHAKDEWHVYNLQCQIALPGAVVSPPSSAALVNDDSKATRQIEALSDQSDDDYDESQNAQDTRSNADLDECQAPTFVPDQCLFCGGSSGTFEQNVAHMAKAHTFIVPYQDCLAVELETLIWYLHLIIHGYIECIFCGTRRNSLEAIQQHMLAKGHCRFDISPETEDFYEISASENRESFKLVHPDEMSLRLPSGRLLGHRSQGNSQVIPKSSRLASNQSMNAESSGSANIDRGMVQRDEKSMAILAARVSHLSTSDQNALSHLPGHEVRSVLATRKRQMDRARRLEIMGRRKVERAGNKTLMKHFKNDVPGRVNG